ncbi:MAG: hypothetical protein GEU88_14275, partial [Solirubrobacterales bacterium]|nr:hypothetical protein [Solirubrobacterales bacterium]
MVRTCHRHGAHAIGGMAALVPNRRDREVARTRSGGSPRGQAARRRATAWTAPGSPIPTWFASLVKFDERLGDRPSATLASAPSRSSWWIPARTRPAATTCLRLAAARPGPRSGPVTKSLPART